MQKSRTRISSKMKKTILSPRQTSEMRQVLRGIDQLTTEVQYRGESLTGNANALRDSLHKSTLPPRVRANMEGLLNRKLAALLQINRELARAELEKLHAQKVQNGNKKH